MFKPDYDFTLILQTLRTFSSSQKGVRLEHEGLRSTLEEASSCPVYIAVSQGDRSLSVCARLSSNSLTDLFPLILAGVIIVNLFHRAVTCANWWNSERIYRGYRWWGNRAYCRRTNG